MIKSTRLRTSLSASTILAAGLLLVVAPAQAQNLPDTGNVSSVTSGLSGGAAGSTDPGFSTSGAAGAQTLRVDLKDNRTILNWGGSGFNVAAGNTVDFKDARATSGVTGRTDNIAVLNRDLTKTLYNFGTPSSIMGTIKSDPNVAVFVINQNGVIFGSSSVTNTGSFYASTLDLADTNFLSNPNSLDFEGGSPYGYGITFQAGAKITTTSTASSDGGRMGDLVLIGPGGIGGGGGGAQPQLTAVGGDVALIAATGVTIQAAPGSPLSFNVTGVVNNFSSTPINLFADIVGRNITAATIKTAGWGGDASIHIQGSLTATGAAVTDRGVVLTTGTNAPGVAFAAPSVVNDLTGVTTGDIHSPKDIGIYTTGSVSTGGLNAVGDLRVEGGGLTTSSGAAGNVTARSVWLPGSGAVGGKITATNGDIIIGNNSLGAFYIGGGAEATGNITSGTYFAGNIGGDVVAGGDIDILAGANFLGEVRAGGKINISGGVGLSAISFQKDVVADTGAIRITTSGRLAGGKFSTPKSLYLEGDVYLNVLNAQGDEGVTLISDGLTNSGLFDNGRIRVGTISTGDNGDVYIRGLQLYGFNDERAGSLVAGRNIEVDVPYIDAVRIEGTRGYAKLTATGPDHTGSNHSISVDTLYAGTDATVSSDAVNLVNATAKTGNLAITANYYSALLGSSTVPSTIAAGGNITVDAAMAAQIRGNATAGGNLRMAAGSSIVLGTTAFPGYQIKAAGTVDITSTSGQIAGLGGVVVQSNSDGIGDDALTLSAGTSISFSNGTSLMGGPSRQSDVRIRSAANSGVTLSSVSARSLLGATGTDPFTNGLTRNSTIGLSGGTVDLVNSLYVSGTFLVLGGAVNVSNGDIDLRAANGVFSSTPPALTASRDVTVTLSDPAAALTLGDVTGGRNVSISANSINLGRVEGTTGTVQLTGGSVVAQAVTAGGDFRVDSSGFVLPGDIITGGDILLNSTGDGTLGGTVAAGGDLSVDVAGLLGLGYAVSPTDIEAAGAVTLTGGTIQNLTSLSTTALIRSNKDGVGAEPLTLDAANDMVLSGLSLQGGTNRQSDVQVRFSVGRNLLFGDIKARGLLGASGNATFSNGITNAGKALFGNVDLINTFSVTAPSITTNNIVVSNGDIVLESNSLPFMINGALTASGDVTINSGPQNLTIADGGSISGRNVFLSTGGAFINSGGADAIAASGHWVVYSDNPTDDTFGGLDSGNTAYWNSNVGSRAPGSVTGNRYVFAYQPTLSVGTQDFDKVYGTDLTGAGSSGIPFAVTGYQAGVAGAFLGDTAASAFSGQPLITSAGFAARATVAGGPYTQTIALGSLHSDTGYAITIAPSAGLVTVTPKALTASVIADNKTYDGTTAATGSVTLNGVVAGDTVETTGTTFTFADKNAGTGKTVNVTGTTLTGADMGNYTLTVPASVLADILKKALTVTVTANGKTYDGTTATTGTVTIAGVLAGDTVGTSGSTFAFADKNAGTGKAVNVTGTTLTGADAGNYSFTIPANVVADILKKAITASVTANNKTYDGTTAGTGTVTLNGVVTGDALSTAGTTFTFSDKNAGTGKTVTVAGTTLTGADAGNYTVTVPASALADILTKALTASVVVNNKTYDGTTAGTGTVTINGVVSGDTVGTSGTTFTFADKNAGSGKTVTVAGTTLTGADAGNYSLTVPASALADILKKALTASVVANTKTYDGTTAGTGTVTLNGVVSGDAVNTSGTTFTFSDKNAGTGKAVAVAGTTLTGADAGNYTLTVPASALADILKKALTATVVANGKTYDGTTAATGAVTLNGVVTGDTVGTAGTSLVFADKNAGTGKTVNVSGTTLTGGDAGNYTLTVPATVLADILKKAITASVVANGKTYDGTTTGSGTVTLNGVLSGDTVATSGTTFTFSDKNAGTGKTVTVAGTTLTGADGGNYTVTVPTSALADILKKAITASFSVSKTYDGTTAGTGTVTLNGVVSGDNVTTSGTTFTYADKNAGTGKAVAVAGTTIGGTDAGNYTITIPASALGDILKRALSVTADDASKVQNDPDPALTYALTSGSLVSGDAFSGGVARDSGENPGTYAISIGTLSAGDNYTITFTPGTFTINLPLGSEGLQPALKAQPLPSQIGTGVGASSGSSVSLDTGAVCGDDKNCTTGKPAQ